MHKRAVILALTIFTLGSATSFVLAAEETNAPPVAETAPDNTGRNERDRSGATLTPGDQSESKADRTLTQRIRKAVVKDKSLSTTAHNIKIITNNGIVTLRGPVKTEQERDKIAAKATHIAGVKQVDNQLEVTHD
jgi:osmotically-inducible protein OsmY